MCIDHYHQNVLLFKLKASTLEDKLEDIKGRRTDKTMTK
jgi:hypothetical protein